MPSDYFISYRHQAYFGYVKRKKRLSKKCKIFLIITAMALCALAVFLAMVIFYPKDQLFSYAPDDYALYLHSNDETSKYQKKLVQKIQTIFNFESLDLADKYFSFILLNNGKKIILLKDEKSTSEQKEKYRKDYSLKELEDILIISDSKEAIKLIRKNKGLKNFISNWRQRIFFGKPDSSFIDFYMPGKSLSFLLSGNYIKNEANKKEDFYGRFKEKNDHLLIYFSSAGLQKIITQTGSEVMQYPLGTILGWKGADAQKVLLLWQRLLPGKLNAKELEMLAGESDFFAVPNPDKQFNPFELSSYNYVFSIDLNNDSFFQEGFQNFIKKMIAFQIPEERQKKLMDDSGVIELVANIDNFNFEKKEEFNFLRYGENYEIAYKFIKKENGNVLFISNSIDLLNDFLQDNLSINDIDHDKWSKACFGRWGDYRTAPLFISFNEIKGIDDFLANFKGFILNNDGDKGCFY